MKWRATESNPRDLSGFAEWLEVYYLRVSDAPTGIVHCAALVSPCKVGYHIQGNHIEGHTARCFLRSFRGVSGTQHSLGHGTMMSGHCLVRATLVAGGASVLPQLAVVEKVRLKIQSHNLLRALVRTGYQCIWAVRPWCVTPAAG